MIRRALLVLAVLVALAAWSLSAAAQTPPCNCAPVSSGVYFGVDAGKAYLLDTSFSPTLDAVGFGVHAGYRSPSGLAFDLRLDDLGIPSPSGGSMHAGGLGMRYTFGGVVMPFFDVHIGAETYASETTLASDAAIGLALPMGNYVEIDFAARDWLADIGGEMRQAPMFTVGLTIGFGEGRKHRATRARLESRE